MSNRKTVFEKKKRIIFKGAGNLVANTQSRRNFQIIMFRAITIPILMMKVQKLSGKNTLYQLTTSAI